MTKTAHLLPMTALMIVGLASPHAQQPIKPEESAHKTMRLTGCLQAGADAATFKLTGAMPSQQSTSGVTPPPVAPTGTTGGSRDYEVKPAPDKDLKLSTHIGYEVEILARPIEPTAPGPTQPSATVQAEPVTPEPALDGPKLERLTVLEITRLSVACR
jgi:hypothetical protein